MSVPTSTTDERAPLLLAFGTLANRMARILAGRHGLASRMLYAPPEAIHAIVAFLLLAPEADRSDAEVGLNRRRNPLETQPQERLGWSIVSIYRDEGDSGAHGRA